MYSEYENPVFLAWTGDGGGGPPAPLGILRAFIHASLVGTERDVFKRNPRVSRVGEVLSQAVERLIGQAEHDVAALVKADLSLCIETLESRCAELPLLLETTQQPGRLLEWSRTP